MRVLPSVFSVCGWNTSRFRPSAKRFTGLMAAFRPRPAGRSGCVSTRATSWPACNRRASARSAKSGVPAKTRRRKARSGGLAQLLRELGADALLLELRQVLDKHLALQMIHLVLDANGKQALRFKRERVAVLIVGTNLHALRALDQLIDAGHRETSFLDVGYAGRFDDFRVHEHYQGVAALGDVDDDHLLVQVDLGGGQPDAGRRVHGFGHIGNELFQRFVEDSDRGGYFMQPGVGVAKNAQKRHLERIYLQIE